MGAYNGRLGAEGQNPELGLFVYFYAKDGSEVKDLNDSSPPMTALTNPYFWSVRDGPSMLGSASDLDYLFSSVEVGGY